MGESNCRTCNGANMCPNTYPKIGSLPDGDIVVTFDEAPTTGYLRVILTLTDWRGKERQSGYSYRDATTTKHKVHQDQSCRLIGRHFVIPSRNARKLMKDIHNPKRKVELLSPTHGRYLRLGVHDVLPMWSDSRPKEYSK